VLPMLLGRQTDISTTSAWRKGQKVRCRKPMKS
jgi:hypothetical protein